MPEYRRAFVPGGTFFFTLVTEARAPIFAQAAARSRLRQAMEETARRWPFAIQAIVLLPDHLHTIWTLPADDADFSTRWAYLKKGFTRAWLLRGGVEQQRSGSRRKNRRRGVWQRRFWEHAIRDEADLAKHSDYIHYNPVKHGLTKCPHAWPHSSFHRWVRQGVYDRDWLCACARRNVEAVEFGDLGSTAME